MGKGSSETKKKKKGRPSLLDIQKRLLKQQKSQASSPYQNPNGAHGDPPPNPSRRSTGRNPGRDGPYPSSDWVSAGGDDDDDDDERAEKKHRLLLGLDSNLSANSSGLCGSDSNASADNHEAALVTRRIGFGSDYPTEKVSKVTDTRNGSLVESGPTTPLPDKKLLVFILDRLQKKDSYGVFSEPVDPEELPDYHDIIKNPMDFGTVKKKLDEGAYINLEQFEKDIFLICSNAMQYNAPDTVFFRQARAMQDIAKKDFENLRQDSDSEPEQPKVVRRGRPPGRGLKKLLDKPSVNGVCREGSSDATLANVDNSCWSNTYNLRVHNPGPSDSIGNATHRTPYTEGQPSWFSDLENEFPVSVWKAVQKNGKKLSPSEENKRDTYKQQFTSRLEKSGSFDGELKHLSAVGVYLNHGYARSLARFAADLGPAVWRIASKKIENVLPNGVQFGPGWVGEDDRHLGRLKSCISSGHPCEDLPMTAAVKSSSNSSGRSPQSAEDMETLRRLNSQSKFINAGDLKPLDDTPATSFTGEINMVTQPMPAMVAAHTYEAPATVEGQRVVSSNYATAHPTPGNVLQSTTAELSGSTGTSQPFNPFRSRAASEEQWWNRQGVPMERKQDVVPIVLYQNNGFQLQGSLNSNLQLGSPRQPDLALQL